MTTEDFEVSLLPYSEIQKMNLQKEIPYYKTKGEGVFHQKKNGNIMVIFHFFIK